MNGSESRSLQSGGTQAWLNAVHFADATHGWAVGEGGTILARANGGETWTAQASGTKAVLTDMYFTDARRGCIVGLGTLLATRDGGQTWQAVVYRRYPAPWYWLVATPALSLAWWAWRSRDRGAKPEETVADMLASDRPLEHAGSDVLGLDNIAAGLARFISNRNTEPPVTIAITGEWGTGKSSLMNLLRARLKAKGFSPVWFNAWHHQQGEQLLASLFAHIREQAIPDLLSLPGLTFRGRLFLRRAMRHKLLLVLFTILAVLSVPYLYIGVAGVLSSMFALERWHLTIHPEPVTALLNKLASTFSAEGDWDVYKALAGLAGGAPVQAAFLRAIRGFGLDPATLMTPNPTDHGKRAPVDPGARARFARDFRDVADCLDLGSIVIFIDDLDRCRKEQVVEILETINFLAVSGNCFIVVGMAEEWVETCIELQFQGLANASIDNNGQASDGKTHRRDFAKNYLEKLINIEVPVPPMSPLGTTALLAPEASAPSSILERWWQASAALRRKLAPLAVLVGLIAVAVVVRDRIAVQSAERSAKQPADLVQLTSDFPVGTLALDEGRIRLSFGETPSRHAAAPGGSGRKDFTAAAMPERNLELWLRGDPAALDTSDGVVLASIGEGERRAQLLLRYQKKLREQSAGLAAAGTSGSADVTGGAAAFEPADSSHARADRFMSGTVLLGILITGTLIVIRRPQRFTEDSRSFKDALKIWQPWVLWRQTTPRAVKRFLNRLRYIAMRYARADDSRSLLDAWLYRFRSLHRLRADDASGRTGSAEERNPGSGIPLSASGAEVEIKEPALVALGAIHQLEATWVSDDSRFNTLVTDGVSKLLVDDNSGQAREASTLISRARELNASISAFKRDFAGYWPPTPEQRRRFLEILAQSHHQGVAAAPAARARP